MNYSAIIITLLFVLAFLPLFFAGLGAFKKKSSKKTALVANIVSVFSLCILIFAVSAVSALAAAPESETETESDAGAQTSGLTVGSGIGLVAAALATGCSCLGGGIAVASSASAAIGAISENPKIFGQALIFVAFAEGVALYGLVVSLQILEKI